MPELRAPSRSGPRIPPAAGVLGVDDFQLTPLHASPWSKAILLLGSSHSNKKVTVIHSFSRTSPISNLEALYWRRVQNSWRKKKLPAIPSIYNSDLPLIFKKKKKWSIAIYSDSRTTENGNYTLASVSDMGSELTLKAWNLSIITAFK